MNFFQWIENSYVNGELFFYVVPAFLFVLLLIVIFIPDTKSEDKKKQENDDIKPSEAKTVDLTKGADLTRSAEEIRLEPETEKITEIKKATLKDGLEKTRGGFISKLKGIFGSKAIDDDVIEELEEILYTADIGVNTVSWLMEAVQNNRSKLNEGEDIKNFLKERIRETLLSVHKEMPVIREKPTVYLMVGVNGAGKTTTIGKLASKFKDEGKSCVLGAADTFRAAAVEQIKVWGERTGAVVISDKDGADPASVAHNAITSAVSKEKDIVMIDTAGRLQNRVNLMEELKKIKRVVSNLREGAPHETILVIDANNGQNALSQAKQFNEAVDLSGIIVTKLDGTAKGGVLIGIAKELAIPVYMIGIGESLKDLRPFNPEEFVEALFL